MKKYFLAGIGAVVVAVILVFSFDSQAKVTEGNVSGFTVASYNVENLFDMVANGSEYPEYIPNFKGWDEKAHATKLANTAHVIKDINADIMALQEVENENALKELLVQLKKEGVSYPYYVITKNEKTAVQNVIISKFKITSHKEIELPRQYRDRPILKAIVQIGTNELVVYANHWKAKTGPESKRIEYANALAADIAKLPEDTDFVLLGDFNSNYNEMESFANDKKLNDTNGLTGINHIIKTAKSTPNTKPQIADKVDVIANAKSGYMYNLWLELPKHERVSEWFAKDKNTPDNIIVPRAMFDKKGISYDDGSFKVFAPSYLLKNGRAFRWESGGKSKKFSVPQGYSDHLPVIAKFRVGPFDAKDDTKVPQASKAQNAQMPIKTVNISELYSMGGNVDVLVKNAAVVYKHQDSLVIKQKNGRAIFVYRAPAEMQIGGVYDVRIGAIEDYHGLKEAKNIIDHKKTGEINPSSLMIGANFDLSDKGLQNEIVSGVTGLFSKGKFVYGDGKEIKMYFRDKTLKPKNLTQITLKSGHIGFYNEPQIIIYKQDDFEIVK